MPLPTTAYLATNTVIPRKSFVTFTWGATPTITTLIGKMVGYDQTFEMIAREVPDADGYLRPDRQVPKKHTEKFKFETEDIKAIAPIFGGVNGGFQTGTALFQIIDPNDASGHCAIQSNIFKCTCILDGSINFNAGEVAKCSLLFEALEKVILTPDATVV